jgi:hypothetical protein
MKAANKKPAAVHGDYEVGYGRPPVDPRFKLGQSGNPRGTSRKLKHSPYEEQLKGIVTDELYRKIPVRDGDRTARIPHHAGDNSQHFVVAHAADQQSIILRRRASASANSRASKK